MQLSGMRRLFCLVMAVTTASAVLFLAQNRNARGCDPSSARNAGVPERQVRVFSASDMAAAFAKGKTLVDEKGLNYKVMTGRRESAGEVEVHVHYSDVIYITKGAATFVTGGRVTDPRTVAPGEIRGRSVAGGVAHHLEKGSLVVVPAGTPHWFKSVTAPVVDLVIKVRTR